ncbi:right-handed parallel beta-helix repeat-containing protein [Fodinicola feengrottensis]|uniref:right-handed parallel beta-helix repeat-containing protein n=1 Tax=Fodinicola feengrottensis TaxID=435914 RepID=UPI0013D23241|nr:right-handed parallel beta-helix repeat-containing protein [Fodinicola feengrottensis]
MRRTTIDRPGNHGVYAETMGVVTIEDSAISQAGATGITVKPTGTVAATNTRVDGATAGAMVNGGTGTFTGLTVTDVVEAGVGVEGGGQVTFVGGTVRRCAGGIAATDEGSQVVVRDATVADAQVAAMAVDSGARLSVRHSTVERGVLGLVAGGSGKLTVSDCTVTDGTARSGVFVSDEALLTAQRLSVRSSGGAGLQATDSARLEVLDSEFVDGSAEGLRVDAGCTGRLLRCRVAGNADEPVLRSRQVRIEEPVETAPDQIQVPAGAGADVRPSTVDRVRPAPSAMLDNMDELDGLAELTQLVGLEPVKAQVRTQINLVRNAKQREAVGLLCRRSAGTWCSPAQPAPARPPSPACTAGCSPRAAHWPPVRSSRPAAVTSLASILAPPP